MDVVAAAALVTEEAPKEDEPALMMRRWRCPSRRWSASRSALRRSASAAKSFSTRRAQRHTWAMQATAQTTACGTSNHMTGNGKAFCELNRDITGQVKFGDGSTVDIVNPRGGGHRILTDVYYIPCLCSNIISLGQLDEDGCQVLIEQGVLRVQDPAKELLVKVRRSANRLYKTALTVARPVALLACVGDDAWRWHERLGHLSFDGLNKLGRGAMVRGLPQMDHPDQLCEACLASKQRRGVFPQEANYRAKDWLDLVHSDLCGPISPATHGGRRYFLLLINDVSRYMWLVLLTSKNEAAGAIKRFQPGVEVETGRKLRALRTDRGGEFTAVTFREYCAEKGVHRQLMAPYSPQQNGVVERRNQTMMAMGRCLLKARKVPGTEAMSTTVFLLNRSPIKSVDGKTPYEAWHGEKPAVHFLCTFGCLAHVKVTRPHGPKLDDRSIKMVFVGYKPGSKAYGVYDPVSGRLHISWDVVFDEAKGWPWEEADAHPDSFTVKYTRCNTVAPAPEGSPQAGHGSTPPHINPEPEQEEDGASRRYRKLSDCIAEAEPHTLDPNEWLMMATEEPSTYDEAATDPAWRAAMEEEMEAIEANGTWEVMELLAGHRPIGLKWVFKLKKEAQGIVVRHKARLVAKGYMQRADVEFEEVFTPAARLDSMHTLAAVAAHEGWRLHHLDVKSAFLNGDLKEEVYIARPPGFVIAGRERQVLRLHKVLYGVRQAPRAWNAKLDRTLVMLGFKRCEEEHGVYTRGEGHGRVLLGMYVDDLILTGAEDAAISAFKDEMKSSFKMSDLGCLSYYLGIEVKQERGRITLCQAAYAVKLLDKAGMADCNSVHIPMEGRPKISQSSSNPRVDSTLYRSIMGSLRYLVHTRSDISFAMGYVSRFMASPTTEHIVAVKHLLRYIAGTIHYGLSYDRQEGGLTLLRYRDSGMASDADDRKSTSGVLFRLGRSPVSWQSQKQPVVALSSCEAQYIAAAMAACQGIWLGRLLGSFYVKAAGVATINIDNQSTIQLCKNPVFHDRSKHIETRFHFIRDCVEGGHVVIWKIHTNDQLEDILTKSLGKVRFQVLRSKLGVVDHIGHAWTIKWVGVGARQSKQQQTLGLVGNLVLLLVVVPSASGKKACINGVEELALPVKAPDPIRDVVVVRWDHVPILLPCDNLKDQQSERVDVGLASGLVAHGIVWRYVAPCAGDAGDGAPVHSHCAGDAKVAERARKSESSMMLLALKMSRCSTIGSCSVNVVTGKWLYKHKFHSDGMLAHHKARWVVCGFSQQPGVDCDETFSPVVKQAMPIYQLDIKNVFLHGHVTETVYCQQPPGFVDPSAPDHVFLLQKSLYGLKQAPRAWYQWFASYICRLSFVASSSDTCLFVYKDRDNVAYLLLYVDDILSYSTMTDLGDLHHFLDVSVTCSPDGLFLSQRHVDLLQRAGMAECHSTATPVDTQAKLSAMDGAPVADAAAYRSLAGALQYLTFTCLDLAYAVQQVCLFMHDPREPHLALIKRILRYIKGTLSVSLHIGVGSVQSLVAYSDADWAGCLDSRRSTSGYCVFLGDNLVSWSSKRQTTVSGSSAEAEYRVVAHVVDECCWLRQLLQELHISIPSATTVYYDNVSAVYMTANPVHHRRTKHIEIDIHFVREKFRALHVPSTHQFADIMTKGLPVQLFTEFRSSLCVRDPPAATTGF
ncbi:LOW QUALITY PROTEIN: hypothetical protein U9M48_002253 [Paspalum notatum var. saurae]|uniref:Integrase catalytic domain-containing protein n=1 Tax=Paspalum notatum var. saurae TaxID=547442 RepID=A0AAQ3PKN7_PASNO